MKYSSTLLALFFFLCLQANAQTISGKVTKQEGGPIPFVIVQIKGTHIGVVSDTNGVFNIKIDSLHNRLIFSASSFQTKEVTVISKDSVLEVVLLRTSTELSEVVVTGYGTKKKKDVVYDEVNIPHHMKIPPADASAGLYGRVAGVSVTPATPAADVLKSVPTVKTDVLMANRVSSAPPPPVPQSGQQVAVKQLTAGEVNDFNKWKMWEDYSQTDFKTLGKQWSLFTTERYCVLLQNKQHAAIVDKQVWLINRSTGDTVWQAVTDNTGKAELWANVNTDSSTKTDLVISCAGCTQYNNPSQFANGVNKLTLDAPCKASKNVDIAFVVDATGSMQDEIDYLKAELVNILDGSTADFSGVTLKAGAVFYRDKDDIFLTKYSGLDTNLTSTYNFIKQQDAGGGGDVPEAVNDGLRVALNTLQWSSDARARILFLVLDAPPHDAAKDEMFLLMKQAAAKGIRIIPVVCSGADKSAEFMMRNIALTTNGTYVFLTDDSGIGDSHIKPTTDKYDVELLTNLLQRLIKQMIFVNNCEEEKIAEPVIKQPTNKLQLKIMPNPTQGMITINSNKDVKEMYVTDFTGKILMRVTDKGNNIRLNIGDYPNGMYLIRYLTNDNEWGAEKVVLMH